MVASVVAAAVILAMVLVAVVVVIVLTSSFRLNAFYDCVKTGRVERGNRGVRVCGGGGGGRRWVCYDV